MSSTENPNINSFLRHNRVKALAPTDIRRISVFGEKKALTVKPFLSKSKTVRHIVLTGETFNRRSREPFIAKKSFAREYAPLEDRNVINYKAAVFASTTKSRIGSSIDVKVGLFGSQSRLGQAVQAVGSMAIPGDASEIRSPIRSRLYSALIPGGGGGRRGVMSRTQRGYRCPAGFEHGGRFTDSRFSTCGAQLFGIPNLGRLIGSRPGGVRDVAEARAERVSETITGMTPQERAIQIQRMAQIPRSGAENPKKRFAVTIEAIKSLSGAPAGEGRLIRKDGVMLRPLVPSSVLRNFGGNPDMENANFVRVIGKPSDIVGDDLALLSGPAVRQITYVTPNGSTLSIERQRDLTVGERRKFGRQLNRVAGTSDQYDVGNTIREFANNSGGAFKYSEKFPNIPKPLEMIEVEDDKGRKISVRRWVYETFMTDANKPSKQKIRREVATLASDDTSGTDVANNVADAVKILDEGGDPMDISANLIGLALSRSKRYQSRKMKSGVTEWSNGSENMLLQIPERRQFGAVAEKTYRDVSAQLGVKQPAAKIGGTPDKRFLISRDVTSLGGKQDFELPLSSVDKKDLLSVAVTDFLLDARDRSPANLTPTRIGDSVTVIPSSNDLSAGVGLNANELTRRRSFDLPDYWTPRQRKVFADGFVDADKIREDLAKHIESLIERARKFNWQEYSSRVAADGQLSDGEKKHLEVVKKIFDARLSILAKAKESFLNTLGI